MRHQDRGAQRLDHGLPTDDWKPDFASLTDKSYRRHPNIIPFGYGEATAGMLKEVSTIPGAAFQFQGGSTTDALQRSVPALLGTLTASARVGELRLPAKVDGFVNVSLPEDHAQRQSSSGGVTGWKPVGPRRDWPPSSSRPVGPSGQTAAAGGEGEGGAGDPYAYDKVPPARRRYLKGQYPASVPLGRPFILLVSIVLEGPASAALKHFDVPPEGRDVLVAAHAPGLRLLGDQRLTVHVPHDGGSEPVMFELRADAPGPRSVSVTARLGGSYLGELLIDITVERDRLAGPHREVLAEIATEPAEGAVSLVVRYDPIQKVYRFEFRDEDNPEEVTSNLAYEPGPLVEQLVAGLDDLAKGRSGLSGDEARSYLVESGAALWRELVPPQLREQFWDRQDRIGQLTILADKDAIPWELLYPMDPGHDAGFLVEQFWVTRAIFGRRPTRRLSLWPARFVLPGDSLPEARDEIDAMRLSLDPGQSPDEVISRLKPLQDLIAAGNFGLLHFACHNAYNPVGGLSIKLGNVQFTPTLMSTAAINKPLANSEPTVFINACRSAGLNATYNRLDGWASKFLDAGAATPPARSGHTRTQPVVSTSRREARSPYGPLTPSRPPMTWTRTGTPRAEASPPPSPMPRRQPRDDRAVHGRRRH